MNSVIFKALKTTYNTMLHILAAVGFLTLYLFDDIDIMFGLSVLTLFLLSLGIYFCSLKIQQEKQLLEENKRIVDNIKLISKQMPSPIR